MRTLCRHLCFTPGLGDLVHNSIYMTPRPICLSQDSNAGWMQHAEASHHEQSHRKAEGAVHHLLQPGVAFCQARAILPYAERQHASKAHVCACQHASSELVWSDAVTACMFCMVWGIQACDRSWSKLRQEHASRNAVQLRSWAVYGRICIPCHTPGVLLLSVHETPWQDRDNACQLRRCVAIECQYISQGLWAISDNAADMGQVPASIAERKVVAKGLFALATPMLTACISQQLQTRNWTGSFSDLMVQSFRDRPQMWSVLVLGCL